MAKKLTDKQVVAADHWVATVPSSRSYTQSYRHAYNVESMGESAQRREALTLFKLPHIVEYVTQRMLMIGRRELQLRKERQQHGEIDAAYVLHKAWLLAEFNIRKFIKLEEKTGYPYYDFRDADDDDWWCIDEMSIDTVVSGGTHDRLYVDKVKIKTTKRRDALKLIGDHVKVAAFAAPGGPRHGTEQATPIRTLQPAERISRVEYLLNLAEKRETEAKGGA